METVVKIRNRQVNSDILQKGVFFFFCFAQTKPNINSLLLKINVSACIVILDTEPQQLELPK